MKRYLDVHPWKIIESDFDPENQMISESLFSIGNGRMGQRATFEETYTGESLQGSYIAGIYYPDKTKVGWWKNGYPEYFAKVLNSVNWTGLEIKLNGKVMDLARCKVLSFERVLDMKQGLLQRTATIRIKGATVRIDSERFYSLDQKDSALMKLSVTTLDQKMRVEVNTFLDFHVSNSDSNYDEIFWGKFRESAKVSYNQVDARTKKTDFRVSCSSISTVQIDGIDLNCKRKDTSPGRANRRFSGKLEQGSTLQVVKYVGISSSYYYQNKLRTTAFNTAQVAAAKGYESMKEAHIAKWDAIWRDIDIEIAGDVPAQQGIRFNLFQLYQTYQGDDPRLNIGPKGFTGEKYGGSTYWDTEAYCLPFYMATSDQSVAENLLLYRYYHLPKAIENAELLGYENGAALYPMVTMNGEECHNEWEITFEEIHRNGAIAYAIFNYTRYTQDWSYLKEYGVDVLIGIARFWAQRVNWSPAKRKYVMLGVTGPNEYENNVNNNWYTNYIARWCLKYTMEVIKKLEPEDAVWYESMIARTSLDTENEFELWNEIVENIFLPENAESNIFLQQEGYLDKENITVDDLDSEDRPLNQHWSWDRILRSPYIKQADVLQGLYFFRDDFSIDQIKNNFEYYEPRTVHESSLSPCIHAILASIIGDKQKAYEMYLRTARLDLDNYNNDTEDGCHITSMAGTWMTIVEGFGGMHIDDKGQLTLNPFLPENWLGYTFKLGQRGQSIKISIAEKGVEVENLSQEPFSLVLFDEPIEIEPASAIERPLKL